MAGSGSAALKLPGAELQLQWGGVERTVAVAEGAVVAVAVVDCAVAGVAASGRGSVAVQWQCTGNGKGKGSGKPSFKGAKEETAKAS